MANTFFNTERPSDYVNQIRALDATLPQSKLKAYFENAKYSTFNMYKTAGDLMFSAIGNSSGGYMSSMLTAEEANAMFDPDTPFTESLSVTDATVRVSQQRREKELEARLLNADVGTFMQLSTSILGSLADPATWAMGMGISRLTGAAATALSASRIPLMTLSSNIPEITLSARNLPMITRAAKIIQAGGMQGAATSSFLAREAMENAIGMAVMDMPQMFAENYLYDKEFNTSTLIRNAAITTSSLTLARAGFRMMRGSPVAKELDSSMSSASLEETLKQEMLKQGLGTPTSRGPLSDVNVLRLAQNRSVSFGQTMIDYSMGRLVGNNKNYRQSLKKLADTSSLGFDTRLPDQSVLSRDFTLGDNTPSTSTGMGGITMSQPRAGDRSAPLMGEPLRMGSGLIDSTSPLASRYSIIGDFKGDFFLSGQNILSGFMTGRRKVGSGRSMPILFGKGWGKGIHLVSSPEVAIGKTLHLPDGQVGGIDVSKLNLIDLDVDADKSIHSVIVNKASEILGADTVEKALSEGISVRKLLDMVADKGDDTMDNFNDFLKNFGVHGYLYDAEFNGELQSYKSIQLLSEDIPKINTAVDFDSETLSKEFTEFLRRREYQKDTELAHNPSAQIGMDRKGTKEFELAERMKKSYADELQDIIYTMDSRHLDNFMNMVEDKRYTDYTELSTYHVDSVMADVEQFMKEVDIATENAAANLDLEKMLAKEAMANDPEFAKNLNYVVSPRNKPLDEDFLFNVIEDIVGKHRGAFADLTPAQKIARVNQEMSEVGRYLSEKFKAENLDLYDRVIKAAISCTRRN